MKPPINHSIRAVTHRYITDTGEKGLAIRDDNGDDRCDAACARVVERATGGRLTIIGGEVRRNYA